MKTENDEDKILLKLFKIRDDNWRSWKLANLHMNEAENEVKNFKIAIGTIESFLHDNTWELSPGDQEDWLLWLDINREELLEAVEYHRKCKEDEIQASINYATADNNYEWTKEKMSSGQFGYISDEDWIENYGKLSLGHEDYCNEEFEFALEDEFVWDFQILNLEYKVNTLYESSLPIIRNPPMKNGLSKDEKKIDLESFIIKSRNMTFIVIKMNGEDVCGKAFSPVMHYVFDRGRCNLEF